MAELVVFFRIGVFAEINGAFYNCKIVFLLHCLTVVLHYGRNFTEILSEHLLRNMGILLS